MDAPHLSSPEADPRDKKHYALADTLQRRALVGLARLLFAPVMRMQVSGAEHLPRTGAAILAANHVTNFDVFPMQFAVPRVIFFMGKAELFRNPLMDIILRTLSAFPVQRGEKDGWALRHAAKVLQQGQLLGMFPEGTRSQGRGLRVAKTGTARMALEARCPILPVAIRGSDRFFRRFPQRTQVHVTLLPLLYPKTNETPLALTDRLMFTLAQALPLEMRGVYAETPPGFDS